MNETLNLHPNDGSTSVSSLSSVTSRRFRHVPFTMIPFEVQHIRRNAEKFVGTQYANVLSPTLVNYDDQEERIAQLEESIKQNRKFIKTTAQKNYQEEVKIRCSNNENPNEELFDKLQVMDVKGIFNYFKELHGTDWISMMKETAPIFLSPAILNKTWISRVKKEAESTLQFSIVKDIKFDGERCYDFAHTILQKHVKDLTSKMYKRYLDKFDLKLLTKLPKKGFVPVLGGEISVNHVPIDINLRVTYVYCVSSLTPNHEETSEYFNEIDSSAQNFVLNKFYGKYYTYFNIIFIILRFITDKIFQ